MLVGLYVITLAALVVSQYDFTAYNNVIPMYVKKALKEKNNYRPPPREKKRTLTNLTLAEIFTKIKEITKSLNENALANGYKVDYRFRILNSDTTEVNRLVRLKKGKQ